MAAELGILLILQNLTAFNALSSSKINSQGFVVSCRVGGAHTALHRQRRDQPRKCDLPFVLAKIRNFPPFLCHPKPACVAVLPAVIAESGTRAPVPGPPEGLAFNHRLAFCQCAFCA